VHRGCESTRSVVLQRIFDDVRSAPMPTECNPELFGFAPVEGRQVVAAFDGGAITSEAGALLLASAGGAP
jgi:hypothetical protein